MFCHLRAGYLVAVFTHFSFPFPLGCNSLLNGLTVFVVVTDKRELRTSLLIKVFYDMPHLAFGNIDEHRTELAVWFPVPFAAQKCFQALVTDNVDGIAAHC